MATSAGWRDEAGSVGVQADTAHVGRRNLDGSQLHAVARVWGGDMSKAACSTTDIPLHIDGSNGYM